jgi:hypothetical protein
MRIGLAYVRARSTLGGFIDFVVFEADVTSGENSDRDELLLDLTARAKAAGMNVDKAALAYRENRHVTFYGTPDLVEYLAKQGVPRWTHHLNL